MKAWNDQPGTSAPLGATKELAEFRQRRDVVEDAAFSLNQLLHRAT